MRQIVQNPKFIRNFAGMIEKKNQRFKTVIAAGSVDRVQALILAARRIVITCHLTPDGDAIGSSLGLCQVLRSLGKDAVVVTPDNPPRQLMFLPGIKDVIIATRSADEAATRLAQADLLFCLDFNEMKRIDKLDDTVRTNFQGRRVVVDHHIGPNIEADVVISHPEVSSTSALVYLLLWQLHLTRYLNRSGAACIYTGMMTDTGNFSYNSNDPDLYIIIADLLRKGVDKDHLYELVCNTNTESRIRICGYARYHMELMPNHRSALMTLSGAELREFNYTKGDTESLVNVPLSIPGVVYSVYLREDGPDYVKVSMRSKGSFPVNEFCEKEFGGGGHLNAAGGEFHGTLAEAVSHLIEAMPNYDKYLNE